MLMADMLDTAPNSITVHDFSGRFLYANSKTFELHGYAEHEFMSMNLHDLDMPASEERIEERIRIIEQEGEAAFEVAHLTKDGKVIPFEVFAKKVRWAGIPALLSVATDLRERKRTEARLQEAKEKAETANRAKNTFLANMSHEIRTPLNAILGFAELLYQISEQATPEQREYLEIIMQRSEDLLKLLNDILSISAMEANRLSVNPERIDLREFTEDLMFLFHEPLRQKNLKGIVHIAEGTPGVICSDPVRLRQVLVNLLGNAVKFTQHGQIELLIEPAGDAVAPSPPIAFSVKDTGIGIPADQQDFIFGHFTQVDQSHTRQFGGAGLGLTVCKGLVELMGGEIEVQSSTNKGSCFRFTVVPFPETADRPAAVPTSDSTLLIDTLPHLHLLLAEDDPAGRRLTEKLLERQGHTFTSVLTGTEALQEWERSSYDLILMDLEMPDMNGVEATREIRRREHQAGVTSGIPIIAMTAHIFPEHREECAEAGMNDFLGKPVRAKELQRIISQWIPVTGS
jgi:PAS domain S-box-containing protein